MDGVASWWNPKVVASALSWSMRSGPGQVVIKSLEANYTHVRASQPQPSSGWSSGTHPGRGCRRRRLGGQSLKQEMSLAVAG